MTKISFFTKICIIVLFSIFDTTISNAASSGNGPMALKRARSAMYLAHTLNVYRAEADRTLKTIEGSGLGAIDPNVYATLNRNELESHLNILKAEHDLIKKFIESGSAEALIEVEYLEKLLAEDTFLKRLKKFVRSSWPLVGNSLLPPVIAALYGAPTDAVLVSSSGIGLYSMVAAAYSATPVLVTKLRKWMDPNELQHLTEKQKQAGIKKALAELQSNLLVIEAGISEIEKALSV